MSPVFFALGVNTKLVSLRINNKEMTYEIDFVNFYLKLSVSLHFYKLTFTSTVLQKGIQYLHSNDVCIQ